MGSGRERRVRGAGAGEGAQEVAGAPRTRRDAQHEEGRRDLHVEGWLVGADGVCCWDVLAGAFSSWNSATPNLPATPEERSAA